VCVQILKAYEVIEEQFAAWILDKVIWESVPDVLLVVLNELEKEVIPPS
jgi:hypothetical protein